MERNEYLEHDGLASVNESHEWFFDKSSTVYAQNENMHGISLPHIFAFVTRDIKTGKYERVLVDYSINEVIFATDQLERIGFEIDKLKIIKAYNK